MHENLLSRWLGDRKVIGHAVRAAALVRVVGALLFGGKLSLTQLGRSLTGVARVKHQIKAVDRLLGNQHLHRERDDIYRALARTLLAGTRRPLIIVDWSDFELGREWVMLKAAVPVGGRAISLYERVFPFKRYNSPGAHREFLRDLRSILPDGCRPILVTDAGFRGPWFRAVEAYGWDWVGRIRNKIKYYRESTGRWCFTDSLYPPSNHVAALHWRSGTVPPTSLSIPALFGACLQAADRPTQTPRAKEAQHDPVSPASSCSVAAGNVVAPRARQRTANQADLHHAHADRGNLSRSQEPPLGLRTPLCALQHRQATRDPASTRHAGYTGRVVGRSCWPHDAVELAAAGQHYPQATSPLDLLHRKAAPRAPSLSDPTSYS